MYKCPYQPIVTEKTVYGVKHTATTFGNCLYGSCPWWKSEEAVNGGFIIPACCMRVTRENPKK